MMNQETLPRAGTCVVERALAGRVQGVVCPRTTRIGRMPRTHAPRERRCEAFPLEVWKMHWLCRILGHRFDPIWAIYAEFYLCERCGHEQKKCSLLQRMLIRFRAWRRAKVFVWARWVRCEVCGRWFGRHDDAPHVF